MDLTLIWSFRNRPESLAPSILSAHSTCPESVRFLLVDANSRTNMIRALRKTVNKFERDIKICESFYRSSLAEAWNLGMMLSDTRYVAFGSSDTTFQNGWYETLVKQFEIGGEYILLGSHVVFGFDRKAIAKMGWFDEGFKNGPHFDPDFMIRATEAGVKLVILKNEGYYTHEPDGISYGDRMRGEYKDRLPMNDFHNETYFKGKWQSNWPGWKGARGDNLPHPPTNIKVVRRLQPEVDPHPRYTEKMKCLA